MKPVSELRRTLGLPLLVLYGLGVTIGAGIFALIGEIAGLAGDHAPLAFLIAGLVAAATGYSYAVLAAAFPRAGGEAVFVNMGLVPIGRGLWGLACCSPPSSPVPPSRWLLPAM
jgi:amino acid transporter